MAVVRAEASVAIVDADEGLRCRVSDAAAAAAGGAVATVILPVLAAELDELVVTSDDATDTGLVDRLLGAFAAVENAAASFDSFTVLASLSLARRTASASEA